MFRATVPAATVINRVAKIADFGHKFDTLFMTFVAGTVALNISYEGL